MIPSTNQYYTQFLLFSLIKDISYHAHVNVILQPDWVDHWIDPGLRRVVSDHWRDVWTSRGGGDKTLISWSHSLNDLDVMCWNLLICFLYSSSSRSEEIHNKHSDRPLRKWYSKYTIQYKHLENVMNWNYFINLKNIYDKNFSDK